MKFTAAFLALVLGAQATLQQRDADSIKKVLSDISNQVLALDTAVNGFSGNAQGLIAAGTTLLTSIKSGTGIVSSSDKLDILSASQVAQSVTGLNTSVATTVNDLIAKKSALVAAGAGGAILKSLQDQKVASQGLSDAITSKVPDTLQTVAKQLSQGVDDSLSSGIAAFQGTGDAPSGAPSASPSASASLGGGGGSNSTVATPTPKPSTPAPASPSATKTGPAPSASASKSPAAASTGAAIVNTVSGVLALAAVAMAL